MKEITIKSLAKTIADAVATILILPLYLLFLLISKFGRRDAGFAALSQVLSLLPGLSGSYLRKNFYRLAMTRCARDCAIMFGTLFSQADTEIGHHVYIGAHCNIGRSSIGDFCTLGSNVHILSGKRQHFFDDLDRPIREQGGVFEKIHIGEDTWIGNGAIVMANVGKKCIIGAGSVVTRDIPDYAIVAGNPARVIRWRKNEAELAKN